MAPAADDAFEEQGSRPATPTSLVVTGTVVAKAPMQETKSTDSVTFVHAAEHLEKRLEKDCVDAVKKTGAFLDGALHHSRNPRAVQDTPPRYVCSRGSESARGDGVGSSKDDPAAAAAASTRPPLRGRGVGATASIAGRATRSGIRSTRTSGRV